ncbi:Hyaluronan/mRNA-binding protein [Fusarium oxysporum f. sp. vasinfectum]|nr:Hyaluronan/mRNA-binding protein [Fusarium oxysporum f. sp. vasinfectum]KAK2934235.1 Hyaluronan/mRNA-binding protein [Fusarium oxysporum f. sp. vasinfectum]
MSSDLDIESLSMTRSHKANDRDHKGIAEGTALPTETVPRFFGKNGFADVDPKKVKKDGSGRGNWGTVNDDIADEQFTFTNTRRRSNSSSFSHHVSDLKTKFEVNEPEPVFEESLHGPEEEDQEDLSKTDSSESGRSSS